MVNALKQGNVQVLESLLVNMGEYPELNQTFVSNRNHDWLPRIEQALQEKEPVFIVVEGRCISWEWRAWSQL
ncbi:MAG: TraB/GumN family protein [Nitrospirota bacterium]|jgi:uncharacterized protein YbaP (TraB family)|nr:TraB/GumN family protein [Nitrospirota bacterium]